MEINDKRNESAKLLQLVGFRIDNEEFGVDILKVTEIIKMISITKVPNSPDYVVGIVDLRGRIIPVVDLRIKLSLPRKENDKHTRILVLEIKDKTIGFIVDEVSEVLRIPENITDAPPAMAVGTKSKYITGVAKLEDKLLILLDMDQLLSDTEEQAIAEIENNL